MSVSGAGSDWWLASDGKWYPPQSQQPKTIETPGSVPGLSTALSAWVQAIFWATAASSAVAAVLFLASYSEFQTYWSTRPGSGAERTALDSWVSMEDSAVGVWGLATLLGLVLLILLIVWTFKAHRVSDGLAGGDRRWSRGWTIGGWFIPAGNLLIPKLVIGEIERLALSDRASGRASADWQTNSQSVKGWLWWVLTVLGLGLVRVGVVLPDLDAVGDSFANGVRLSYLLKALGAAVAAIGAAFGAVYVRAIARRLAPSEMGQRHTTGGSEPAAVPPWTPNDVAFSTNLPLPEAPRSGSVGVIESAWSGAGVALPAEPASGGDASDRVRISEALRQLKALHSEGILTDDEYESKRRALAQQL